MKYIASDGQRLDQIVAVFYGGLEHFEEVLECNPHLIGKWQLAAGDAVELPKFAAETTEENALW